VCDKRAVIEHKVLLAASGRRRNWVKTANFAAILIAYSAAPPDKHSMLAIQRLRCAVDLAATSIHIALDISIDTYIHQSTDAVSWVPQL
jgi:hypothetical protein